MRITMSQRDNTPTFDEAFEAFIRKCRVKNLTDESIVSYQQKIRPFMKFLKCSDTDLADISRTTVDSFILWERENSTANDITINSYLRTVRAVLYFCMEQGYIEHFHITIPKADKKGKETYSDSELEALLSRPNIRKCTFSELKIWAFECFLVGTGVRLSTALNVKIEDLDFDGGFIFLSKTKSRKQTYIPMAKSVNEVLHTYLQYRKGKPDDYVFCDSYGGKADRRTYQEMVASYNHAHGVARTSVHAFRHTFGRLSVKNGIDAFRLQHLMGHSTITVTQEYVSLFGEDLADGYDKYNPLDNLHINKHKIKK